MKVPSAKRNGREEIPSDHLSPGWLVVGDQRVRTTKETGLRGLTRSCQSWGPTKLYLSSVVVAVRAVAQEALGWMPSEKSSIVSFQPSRGCICSHIVAGRRFSVR